MRIVFMSLVASCLASPALADLPLGEKKIVLSSIAEAIEIGKITFTGKGTSRKFMIDLNESLMKDEFLSMRPFKCLESVKRYYCYVPYPYALNGEVRDQDLTDLEYSLLFVQKEPNAYGISLWNGVYYKLELAADGAISGKLNEVDLDQLATPTSSLRPITSDMLNEAPTDKQWLPIITIK